MKEYACMLANVAICCLILYFVSENEWGIWGAIGLFLVVPFMRYKED